MKKDAFLAVLIGFAIGLTITALIIVTPIAAKGFPKIQLPKLPSFSLNFLKLGFKRTPAGTPTSVPAESVSQKFAVDSPLADAIENSSELLVSGTSTALSTVVVQTAADDVVTTTNEQGMWAVKVTLSEGKNDILVTSYPAPDSENSVETQTVTVYYTPEANE